MLVAAVVLVGVTVPDADAASSPATGGYIGGNGHAVVCDPGTGAGIGGACFELDESPTQSLEVAAFDDVSDNVGVTVRAYTDDSDTPVIDSGPFCTFWSNNPFETFPHGITRVEVLVSPQALGSCTGMPTTGTVHLTWQ